MEVGQSQGLAGGLRCPPTGLPGREAGSPPRGGYRRGSVGQVQSADLFCLAHTVFWKKKKISSKLSTFKTQESSPKKNLDFHFLIIITKANISVWLTACGALVSAPLTPRDGPVLQASVLLLAASCRWGSRGGDPGCSWCRVCLPGGRGPGLEVTWARALRSPQPRPLSVLRFLPCPGQGLGVIGLGPS